MNNRRIKFRVWSPPHSKFVIEPRLHVSLLNSEPMVSYIAGFGGIIQFYIGKKDNQGREIYEGDIIKFNILGIHGGREPDMDCVGEVWYDEGDCNWAIGNYHYGSTIDKKQDYDWWYSFMDDIDEKSLTIVGNIFENKELIKK